MSYKKGDRIEVTVPENGYTLCPKGSVGTVHYVSTINPDSALVLMDGTRSTIVLRNNEMRLIPRSTIIRPKYLK